MCSESDAQNDAAVSNPTLQEKTASDFEDEIIVSTRPSFVAPSWFSNQVKEKVIALFVVKAAAVIVGWTWNKALSSTFLPIFSRDRPTLSEVVSKDGESVFAATAMTYACSLLVVACLQKCGILFKEGKVWQIIAKVLLPGLALIPAWGYKDCVAAFLKVASDFAKVNLNALWAAIVLVISAALDIILPDKDPNASFLVCIAATVGDSMALGNGFAFNEIWKQAAGRKWNTCEFQILYAPLVTGFGANARELLKKRIKDPQPLLHFEHLQTSASKDYQRKEGLEKLFNFQKAQVEFAVAWAWDALLEATFDAWFEEPDKAGARVLRELCWSLCITLGGVFFSVFGGIGMIWEILIHVTGPIVGWAWSDVAKAAYLGSVADDDDSQGMAVLKLWLYVAGVTVVCSLLSSLLLGLLNGLETRDKQTRGGAGIPLQPNKVGSATE